MRIDGGHQSRTCLANRIRGAKPLCIQTSRDLQQRVTHGSKSSNYPNMDNDTMGDDTLEASHTDGMTGGSFLDHHGGAASGGGGVGAGGGKTVGMGASAGLAFGGPVP